MTLHFIYLYWRIKNLNLYNVFFWVLMMQVEDPIGGPLGHGNWTI